MAEQASAQASEAALTTDPETAPESGPPIGAEPAGGETAAEAAEPPEQRVSLLRRLLRRSRVGLAALLPALLLAAVYVASPFAGTATHSIDRPSPTATPAYPVWDR